VNKEHITDGFEAVVSENIGAVSSASAKLENSAGTLTKTAEKTQFHSAAVAAESNWAHVGFMYLESFIEPFGTLWFIYLLPVFFVVTKLLRGVPPLVVWLAEFLAKNGWSPGVVSRGYGGTVTAPRAATVASDPAEVGDEPILSSRRGGCPVWVGPDRVEVAASGEGGGPRLRRHPLSGNLHRPRSPRRASPRSCSAPRLARRCRARPGHPR